METRSVLVMEAAESSVAATAFGYEGPTSWKGLSDGQPPNLAGSPGGSISLFPGLFVRQPPRAAASSQFGAMQKMVCCFPAVHQPAGLLL